MTGRLLSYFRELGLDIERMTPAHGGTVVLPIVDCGRGSIDFDDVDGEVQGFVCEAIGEDGETTDDLPAWPVPVPAIDIGAP